MQRNTVKMVDNPLGKNKKKQKTEDFRETLGMPMACGGKVHKKAKGGQVCKGMGAASRGGKFSKNG